MGVNGIYGLSGSGLDIESMVKVGMMSRQNEYDKMMQKYTQNEWKKTAYIELNNQITTFNMSTLSDYKMSASMNSRAAESSNESAVKVSANASASIMSHRVDVAKLSTNAHLISTTNDRIEIEDGFSFKIGDGTKEGDDYKVAEITIKDGASMNDVVSEINTKANNLGLNIRATYDNTNNKFSLYNTKASGADGIYIDVGEDDDIATDFFNSLELYQSTNGKLISPETGKSEEEMNAIQQNLSKIFEAYCAGANDVIGEYDDPYGFAEGEYGINPESINWGDGTFEDFPTTSALKIEITSSQKFIGGTYGEIIIDGVSYNQVEDNKITVDGITYTALNTTGNYERNTTTEYLYGEDDKPIIETDSEGNELYRPKLDENGNPVYNRIKKPIINYSDPVAITDDDYSNKLYVKSSDSDSNDYKEATATDIANANTKFYVQTNENEYREVTAEEIGTPVLHSDTEGDHYYRQATVQDVAEMTGKVKDPNSDFVYWQAEDEEGNCKYDITYEQVYEPVYKQIEKETNDSVFVSTGAVTVSVSQNVDSIVDKVKSFVESYNKILGSLYEKYDEKADSNYKPLTQSQKDSMKDEQIEKWEEKAKQGLLYHDSTLGKIINDMRNAISAEVEGVSGDYSSVFSLGISTTGIKGQLVLDEEKLRKALAADSDSVYNVFAKLDTNAKADATGIIKENGIAQRLGDIFTNATKLIRTRAGSSTDITEDSDLNNLLRELQTKMSNFKKLMSAFEDRLYKKYDAMEAALAKLGMQMNFITGGQ